MSGRQACPELGALARVLNETGAEDEAGVAAHLERCAGCRRRLEALAGDTPSPDALRGLPRPGLPPEEPLRRAIAALKGMAPAPTGPPRPVGGPQ